MGTTQRVTDSIEYYGSKTRPLPHLYLHRQEVYLGKTAAGFSRAFLIITGTIVLLLVTGYLWGFQTMIWWEYRHSFEKKSPILNLTPRDRPNTVASLSEGMKLSHAGIEFQVPWTDLDKEKSKVIGNAAIFSFRSGRVLTIFGPNAAHEGLFSTIEKQMGDQDRQDLRKLFGPEATGTDYAFHKTLLEETPAGLRPWMSQREAYRSSLLLMFKAISSVGGETGLFAIQANGWKGFQFDDPANTPMKVTLELYDSTDRHIEIIFARKQNSGMDITQADVNRVLKTLNLMDPLLGSEAIKPTDLKAHN